MKWLEGALFSARVWASDRLHQNILMYFSLKLTHCCGLCPAGARPGGARFTDIWEILEPVWKHLAGVNENDIFITQNASN